MQIVKAILKQVQRRSVEGGGFEGVRRGREGALTGSKKPFGFLLNVQTRRDWCTAKAHQQDLRLMESAAECCLRARASFRGSVPPGGWLFSSHRAAGHSSWTQHFVCISVSSVRAPLSVVSLRASDAALPHLPPTVRSVPPLSLHPLSGQWQSDKNITRGVLLMAIVARKEKY